MSFWVPDVPIGATVAMARRWFKGAKPVKVAGAGGAEYLVPVRKEGKVWVPDVEELEGAEDMLAAARAKRVAILAEAKRQAELAKAKRMAA
jgi:hypothetical protein